MRGTNQHDEMLSIEQSAARLGIKPVTLRAWIAARRIGRVKLGRRVLVPAREISRLIEENFIPARPDRAAR